MRLFLLFLIVPLIEIALFIQVGGAIGIWWTLAVVVLTAMIGTALVRSQGLMVLHRLRNSLESLDNPAEPLAHGAMILFSGALLLTPGFFTDFIGFCLLMPGVRTWLFGKIRKHVEVGVSGMPMDRNAQSRHDTIDGEYREVDASDAGHEQSGWTRH